jgi:hypothetical protein
MPITVLFLATMKGDLAISMANSSDNGHVLISETRCIKPIDC